MIQQGWLYYIFVSSLFVPPLNFTLTNPMQNQLKNYNLNLINSLTEGFSITIDEQLMKNKKTIVGWTNYYRIRYWMNIAQVMVVHVRFR